jgi:hypothetical protein
MFQTPFFIFLNILYLVLFFHDYVFILFLLLCDFVPAGFSAFFGGSALRDVAHIHFDFFT